MPKLCDWLDDRTGYRNALTSRRERMLPRGPCWRRAIGPAIAILAVVEGITGLLLMTVFSPSATTAWASVRYIEQLPFGWFLRGLHYWGGQALIVLFASYMLGILLTADYRRPRELAWITGLFMLPLIVIWTLSGGLITGTQTAYGQIDVETNVTAALPIIGPPLRRLILGGEEIGHLTITHLFFVHVALLPIVVGALAVLHVWQSWRAESETTSADDAVPYRPYQSIRNLFVSVLVLAAVASAAWWRGAPVDMPADTSFEHVARPEWYFASLMQLRHYFTGPWEIPLTMAAPGLLLLLLLVMPLLDRRLPTLPSVLLRVAMTVACLGGWGLLTYIALTTDYNDADLQAKRAQQKRWTQRAVLLADHNAVPPEGAITLLRRDAKTQGPKLYAKHCATCHPFVDPAGKGSYHDIPTEEPSAPNLYGFATREWIAGTLDMERISGDHYFGKTAFAEGEMVEWVRESIVEWEEDLDEEELAEFRAEIQDVVVMLSAEAALISQKEADKNAEEQIARGRESATDTFSCTDCHKLGEEGSLGSAPDLTGYGSRQWLIDFINDPAHNRFYPESNDRMPSYAPDGEPEESHKLDRASVELIVDWLRGQWYEPPAKESP